MASRRAKAATGNRVVIDDATNLLDELAARYPIVGERQPDDVDKYMLAKRRGISIVQAARILYDEYMAGKLTRALVRNGHSAGSMIYVYRRKAVDR